MPAQEPDYIRDYLASLRAHQDDGTLDDGRLTELLEVIGSRFLRAGGEDVPLSARQHAAAKEIAAGAIQRRGGLFPLGRVMWRADEGRLGAEMS